MGMKELFEPRGVAVFGSVSPGKLGGVLINQIAGAGYEKLYAVNPKAARCGIAPGFASILDVPQPVDMAVIASPAPTVAGIFKDLYQKGVTAAVVISSGFSEAGNVEGERELQRLGREYGISFIGPNCAGLLNTHHNLAATLQAFPPKGHTAIISQSGAVGGAIMEWAQSQSLGISKFASYGNGADLNQVEFLRYLKDDPQTKVVGLYIENINDGRAFMDALSELSAVKPVVVIKSGRTATGQRAALSHTGSMAGSDAVYDAAIAQAGAIRVNSLDEMIDLCKGFAYLPPVKGKKVAIVTNSGGPGVMTADLAEELGLCVTEPSQAVHGKLAAFLPSFAGLRNPIDLTVEGTGENYQKAIELMLTEYDACLPIFFGPPYLDTTPMARGMAAAAKNTGKPVVCALETGLNAKESGTILVESGIPNFSSTERAITVIARMHAYYMGRGSSLKAAPQGGRRMGVAGMMPEPQAAGLLEKSGISMPRHAYAPARTDVIAACRAVGYPVAIKVVAQGVVHKSDMGGVKLNIQDDGAALAAYDEIAAKAEGLGFAGIMAYEMVRGGHEVILGLTRDKQFGPAVLLGMGGVYTEIMKDIGLRIAPVEKEEALCMIRNLRSYPLLKGARGAKAADEDKLAEMIARFSLLPFQYEDLQEADLNPVFVSDTGAVAGDIRLIFG